MGNFLSCSCVSTTVWLHHRDSNKIFGEKARWALHKNAACYLVRILEAAHPKTTAGWPLASHLMNHPSKMSKTCWALRDELICDVIP